MRPSATMILLALALPGCEAEPENIQAKSETMSRQLEERANQIGAEAENDVEVQAAPLENEADALLNRMSGNESAHASAGPANAQ
ncbi:MAG: hypothetical protein ABWX67_12805 [Allosphingosinicella sp.]